MRWRKLVGFDVMNDKQGIGKKMTRSFAVECLLSDLSYAMEHAKAAGMDIHFTSDISHLITVAEHNKEEIRKNETDNQVR